MSLVLTSRERRLAFEAREYFNALAFTDIDAYFSRLESLREGRGFAQIGLRLALDDGSVDRRYWVPTTLR